MTSRAFSAKTSPSRHAFAIALREGAVIGVLGALLLAFVIAAPAVMEYTSRYIEEGAISYLFGIPDVSQFYTFYMALFGVVQGLFAFRILFNRSASNTYFGLGVTRRRLFAARWASGALWLAAGTVAAMSAGVIVNLIYSTHTGLIFARALYIGAGLFATGFFAYCVTALVCTLTGTLAEALAYSLLALLLPTLLLTGLGGQMLAFLSGNAYGIRNAYKYDLPGTFVAEAVAFNPLFFFHKYLKAYCGQIAGWEYVLDGAPPLSWAPILGWLAVAAVLTELSRRCFIRRKVEHTGILGACRPVGYLLTLPAVYAGASAFCYLTTGYEAWPVAGALAAGAALSAVVFCALYFPLRLVERRAWKGLLAYPACLAASALIAGILALGGFGYSKYLPEAGDVTSMEISYKGLPNLTLGNSSSSSWFLQINNNTVLTLTEPSDIALGITLHRALLGQDADAANYTLSDGTLVRYTLKNGRVVTRYYTGATFDTLDQMLALDGTAAFAKLFGGYMDGLTSESERYRLLSPYTAETLYLSVPLSGEAVRIDDETSALLRQALKADIGNQSIQERYRPAQVESYVLYFVEEFHDYSIPDKIMAITELQDNAEYTALYIDSSYTETMKLLSGYADSFDVPEIEWIRVAGSYAEILHTYMSKYPYYDISSIFCSSEYEIDSVKSWVLQITASQLDALPKAGDPARIEELYAASRGFYFAGDGGVLILVKPAGSDTVIIRYVPGNLLPAWLAQTVSGGE